MTEERPTAASLPFLGRDVSASVASVDIRERKHGKRIDFWLEIDVDDDLAGNLPPWCVPALEANQVEAVELRTLSVPVIIQAFAKGDGASITIDQARLAGGATVRYAEDGGLVVRVKGATEYSPGRITFFGDNLHGSMMCTITNQNTEIELNAEPA